MKSVKHLGTVVLLVLLIVVPCWGASDHPYFPELQKGNTTAAQRLFWKEIEDEMKPFGGKLPAFMLSIRFMTLFDDVVETEQYDFGIMICTEAMTKLTPSRDLRASLLNYRAQLLEKKEEYAKAIEDYSESIKLDAKSFTLLRIARLLATCSDSTVRDGKKAVEYAQKLIEEAEEETPYHFYILAAAYAEEGNFDDAITAQDKAITLLAEAYEKFLAEKAKENNIEEMKKRWVETQLDYENRLASYKAWKPWRAEEK